MTTPIKERKHTPVPWTIEHTRQSAWIGTPKSGGKVDEIVCQIDTSSEYKPEAQERAEANAAHIVHCVNQHDNLVAALKTCQYAIDGLRNQCGDTEWGEYTELRAALEQAKSALSSEE